MGQTMRLCYNESAYKTLFEKVEVDMRKNKEMCDSNKAFLKTQHDQIEQLKVKCKLITETAKRREEARVWFDHYRKKVNDLNESEAKKQNVFNCGPAGDRDKLMRNQDKLQGRKSEFDRENNNADKLVKDIHSIANTILNELTIRFTVQV